MKLRFLLPCFLSIVSISAFAKGDISGTVINKTTGEPMDFVNIQLINAKTGKPLPIGTNTDDKGIFSLKGVADGKYIVRISDLGSVPQEREATVAGGNIDLGAIRLAEDSKMLQEVTVEGIRSQMRFELDRKVFSVDANIAAAGQSASELLESIPSVEVDQDGEVSLRGNSSVTVWINGKESGLTADNRAQILEQIPAETIDRIEVITNPSAKFSPEGTAGIINIVLKKDRKAGYYGSAEISANSRGGGNASGNINFNSSKVDAFAGIGFRMRRNTGGSKMNREFLNEDGEPNGLYTRSVGKSPNRGRNVFARLGFTYHLTDKDDIGLNGFGMFGHSNSSSNTLYTSNVPGNWLVNDDYSKNNGDHRGMHAEFNYTHKWNDNHTLDVIAGYNHWGGPNRRSYAEEIEYPDYNESKYQEQTMDMSTSSWETKIDYTNKLSEWLKLEAGFNGRYSHEDTPTDTYTGTSQADMKQNEELYNRFIYNNNVSAIYATLGGNINKFSFSAGLRAEAWQIKTRSLGFGETESEVTPFKKNNFALFPSLFLSYSLPHDNEMQINYTRRIRRPWGGQLNSFHDISDPTNVSYGNPELQPQYSNSFELNYLKSWTFHMLSLSAYVRTTSDMMNRISYLDGDVMYSTWANIADEVNSGCEIVAKNSFWNRLDLTTTVNLYNNHISGWNYDFQAESGNLIPLSGKKQNSFAWSARMMANVKLPWSISMQATGNYNSKMLSAQGSRQGGWSVDLGFRRAFGPWSISLNCRDLFDSRRFKSTTNGPDYTQFNERWRGGRTVRLTVKFSFGNMNAKPDKRGNGEPMDGSGYDSGMEG
ncbi:MAG: TonB-dependent receptor [Muribaculaceae bacterium]|nr:TonB-dependent receptor [Muribaculaceae bacterium]